VEVLVFVRLRHQPLTPEPPRWDSTRQRLGLVSADLLSLGANPDDPGASRLERLDAVLAVLARGAGLQASGQPPLEGGLPVPDLPADVQARRSFTFLLPAPQRRQRHLEQLGGVLLG
jgi:hypothetical protein